MTTTEPRRQGPGHVARLLGGALAALFLLFWASTSPTLSAWTTGAVTTNGNSVTTGSLAFSYATAAGTCAQPARSAATLVCAGSIASSTVATPYTDTITNTSSVPSSQVVQTVSLISCGVVKLDNRAASADIMLPRNNTGFQNAGPLGAASSGIAYDGVSAYASTPSSQVLPAPPALVTNGSATWGVGIWFKAASGAAGPLFSFGANTQAIATTGQDDRTLYLNADGTLTWSATTAGTAASRVTTTNPTSYADGGWHFAYVRLGLNALGPTVTLSVDAVGATRRPRSRRTSRPPPRSEGSGTSGGARPRSPAARRRSSPVSSRTSSC